ncbi:MAG: hypothetical protein IPJ93_13595 [Bacteroidota bacterium]|nr:MAG: hypothetical protein IPJ93_13595 [Bacteroidota bacterium]
MNNYQFAIEGVQLPETVLLKETDGREDSTNTDAIFEYIDEKSNSYQGGCYLKDLIEHFVTGKVMSKATLHNGLNKLQKDEKITKPAKGQYKSKP